LQGGLGAARASIMLCIINQDWDGFGVDRFLQLKIAPQPADGATGLGRSWEALGKRLAHRIRVH
jgi:hypothetical protein